MTFKLQLTYISFVFSVLMFCGGCGKVEVPTDNVTPADGIPTLNPDYTGIVLPPNIAPMNFEIDMPGEEYIAKVTGANGKSLISKGKTIKWDMNQWHELLDASKGKNLNYEIYVKDGKENWKLFTFSNYVAEEDIDPFLSYRLIEPSYMQYAAMTINQRDLTSFDETVVFNNASPCDERRGYCINCHVPRNNYKDGSSQFHVRKFKGGTVVMSGDSVRKINLKTDSTLSAGVYPAWHPTLDLIAYSTNDTHQKFFSFGKRKIEVYDTASDLILYDMHTHEVSHIANDPDLLETFPVWHPDGKKIYYSAAKYPDGVTPETVVDNYELMKYDIISRDFNPDTRKFSSPDTVVCASAENQSVLLPRISPDGKYLLYCKAPFGTFHIWHKESDLYITDLSTGEERPLAQANSNDTDSYHSWSSNSRWIVFSSRRDDGSYTRPYITYIAPDGQDSKAFIVPQETPDYYRELMKSYNVPEFFVTPFDVKRQDIIKEMEQEARPASFKNTASL